MSPLTNYIVSTPPHIKAEQDIASIMRWVCLALVPAFAVSAYTFGWYALFITGVCVAACVVTEAVCQKIRHVEITVNDGSAVVTGLLLAAVIPPSVDWWVAAVGGAFAIGIGKHCFGGLGNNIWNPALLARAFLQVAVASQMNSGAWGYLARKTNGWTNMSHTLHGPFDQLGNSPDAVTAATSMARIAYPAAQAKDFVIQDIPGYWQLVKDSFWGYEGGCIAEVSAAMLLLGGLILLWKKIITWEIPLLYLGTVALLGWICPAPFKFDGQVLYTPWFSGPMLLHLVGGGVMIGAFFMATDMVTSPMTRTGKIIFGLGCGIITIMVRVYSTAYPEGVCYSILIMNTCVPLIDAWTRPRKFGLKK